MNKPPMVNACKWIAPMVTLIDGRQVPSDSSEWLLECEARYVLKIPTKAERHIMLDAIEKRRGRDARMNLHDRVLAVFYADKAKNNG